MTAPLEIPASVVSDVPLIPSELQAAYDELPTEVDWDGLYSASLEFRRAMAYKLIGNLQVSENPRDNTYGQRLDGFELATYPGKEHAYDSLVAKAAQTLGFNSDEGIYYDFGFIEGDPSFQTTHYTLQSKRGPLSVGELAWLADWLLTKYPDSFVYVTDIPVILPNSD